MLEQARDRDTIWDVAIIGGGATGLACALDASLRGYRTILLEQADFCKGTSSRSTKLIHGGVRYLRQGDVALVHEALRERSHLLHNASGIVRPLPFVIPSSSIWEQIWYGTGLRLYDLLAGGRGLRRSAWLSKIQVEERLPGLNMKGVRGGTLYFDGQFDDTRLAIAFARTAHSYGAAILNYIAVRGLEKDGSDHVSALNVEDAICGEKLTIRARSILNATGVFGDSIRQMDEPTAPSILRPAQGIHFVLDHSFLGGKHALLIPETDDGRVLFAIPWHGHTLVGTTDTELPEAMLEPKALPEEVDYLLEHAGRFLARKPNKSDIRSLWAGLRPLVKPPQNEGSSAELSRDHSIFVSDSGLITIAGGKWTTCRNMGEDAIDRAIEIGELTPQPCRTRSHKLIPEPNAEGEQLHPNLPYTKEQVEHAIQHELSLTLEDVLARRIRALFLDVHATLEIAPQVAEWMAEALGQDESWKEDQLREFASLARGYLPA